MLHDKVWQQSWELPQQAVGMDGSAWPRLARNTLVRSHPHLDMLFLVCHWRLSRCFPEDAQQSCVQTSRGWNLLESLHLSLGSLPGFGPLIFNCVALWSESDRGGCLKPSPGGSTQGLVCGGRGGVVSDSLEVETSQPLFGMS